MMIWDSGFLSYVPPFVCDRCKGRGRTSNSVAGGNDEECFIVVGSGQRGIAKIVPTHEEIHPSAGIVSNSIWETDGRTDKHARQQRLPRSPPSRRVDVAAIRDKRTDGFAASVRPSLRWSLTHLQCMRRVNLLQLPRTALKYFYSCNQLTTMEII